MELGGIQEELHQPERARIGASPMSQIEDLDATMATNPSRLISEAQF
jgi:hypothetical protein